MGHVSSQFNPKHAEDGLRHDLHQCKAGSQQVGRGAGINQEFVQLNNSGQT